MNKLLVISLVALSGCTAHNGALLDSATTYKAIDSGKFEETNHILPKSAGGAAVVSAAIKIAAIYGVRKYGSNSACNLTYKTVTATGFGAGAHNISEYNDGDKSVLIGAAIGGVSFFASAKNAERFCK